MKEKKIEKGGLKKEKMNVAQALLLGRSYGQMMLLIWVLVRLLVSKPWAEVSSMIRTARVGRVVPW